MTAYRSNFHHAQTYFKKMRNCLMPKVVKMEIIYSGALAQPVKSQT
jgi:hypothetical protein